MCECVCASSMSAKGQSTTSRHATCMLHEHEHELEAGRYLHPVGAKHQHNRHFRPETATDTETLAHTRGRRASACHRRQGEMGTYSIHVKLIVLTALSHQH